METIADELYEWARKNSLTNDVCTIYELVSGEEHTDSGMGMDVFYVYIYISCWLLHYYSCHSWLP